MKKEKEEFYGHLTKGNLGKYKGYDNKDDLDLMTDIEKDIEEERKKGTLDIETRSDLEKEYEKQLFANSKELQ